MGNEPLVSIVIPTYNRSLMLRRAVETCLKQTYRNIEIIIVNDGSIDDTEQVCDSLAASDSRIRAFHKQNGGIAAALNYGFRSAKGDYVTWTSDDNYYEPDAIERMLSFLVHNPDTGFVYCDMKEMDADGNLLGVYRGGSPDNLVQFCVVTACFLYRRQVLEEVGEYNGRWKRCQDYDYYLRVARRFKIDHLSAVLYNYTVHEASMSGNHEAHVLEETSLLSSHTPTLSGKRQIRARRLGHLGRHFENRWRHWKAALYYLRAVPYAPERLQDFLRALSYAVYGSLPDSVKRAWRSLKKTA